MDRFLKHGETDNGKPVSFYWPGHRSPLNIVPQTLVAAEGEHWPASTNRRHWGQLMEPLHGGEEPEVRQRFWRPELRANPLPAEGPVAEAALFVATVQRASTPSAEGRPVGVGYAAILPFDVHEEFDPGVPPGLARCTPWRSIGVTEEFATSDLAVQLGTIALQYAKYRDCRYVHLFMPAEWPLPEIWRGFPCQVLWVGPYCRHIPTAAKTAKPDQMFIRIDLAYVPEAPAGFFT